MDPMSIKKKLMKELMGMADSAEAKSFDKKKPAVASIEIAKVGKDAEMPEMAEAEPMEHMESESSELTPEEISVLKKLAAKFA